MKPNLLYTFLNFCLVAALAACAPRAADGPRMAGHPPLSEQQMLIACQDCHARATPELQQQWYQSGHGIASVKCYQCHGTFEGLRAEPSLDACAVCHSGQWAHAEGNTCWQCHPAHSFNTGQ